MATKTEMCTQMAEDMDINCGDIISAGISNADKSNEIFEELVTVASGKQTKSEELCFGAAECVPWQISAVMQSCMPTQGSAAARCWPKF